MEKRPSDHANGDITTSFRIPVDLLVEVKVAAARQRKTTSDLIKQGLLMVLAQHQEKSAA